MLITGEHPQDLKFLLKWEMDLHTTFSQIQKDWILFFVYKVSLAIAYQKNGYKLLTVHFGIKLHSYFIKYIFR